MHQGQTIQFLCFAIIFLTLLVIYQSSISLSISMDSCVTSPSPAHLSNGTWTAIPSPVYISNGTWTATPSPAHYVNGTWLRFFDALILSKKLILKSVYQFEVRLAMDEFVNEYAAKHKCAIWVRCADEEAFDTMRNCTHSLGGYLRGRYAPIRDGERAKYNPNVDSVYIGKDLEAAHEIVLNYINNTASSTLIIAALCSTEDDVPEGATHRQSFCSGAIDAYLLNSTAPLIPVVARKIAEHRAQINRLEGLRLALK